MLDFLSWEYGVAFALLILIIGAVAMHFAWEFIDRDHAATIRSVLASAYDGYEIIIDDFLWSTANSKILASERVRAQKNGEDAFCMENICKTEKGRWFIFRIILSGYDVDEIELIPCAESYARHRLEKHQDAYFHKFGKPELA